MIPDSVGVHNKAVPPNPTNCYSYVFGELLALALYQKFREEDTPSFVPKFLNLLATGGSRPPKELLELKGLVGEGSDGKKLI